jgi:VWFA-related protein
MYSSNDRGNGGRAMLKSKLSQTISWLIPTFLLVALTLPAHAARRLTVEQLQQLLATAQSTHKPDEETAQQLAASELTTQLSPAMLQQLAPLAPGPKSTQALQVLADESVFLDIPPAEIPPRPAPNVAAQKAIISQTINYVAHTLPTLPDFLATRKTEHYDDAPRASAPGSAVTRTGLSYAGRAQSPVAFRDGRETDDPAAPSLSTASVSTGKKAAAKSTPPDRFGLSSWGEFGPILGIVLVDAAKGKLGWSHWELANGKPVAVFQFSVDKAVSHYTVQYWDRASGENVGGSYGTNGHGASSAQAKLGDIALQRQAAGYHGQLTVDPDTGAILRITIEADLRPDDPIQRAATMVQYGTVKIGETNRICPIHSVSISGTQMPYQATPASALVRIPRIQMNDVQFLDYRRFGSEATIVAAPTNEEPGEPTVADAGAEAGAQPAAPAPIPPPASNPAENPATAEAAKPESPPVAAPPVAPPATVETAEITETRTSDMPGLNPASSGGTSDSGNFTLKVSSQLVDVNLIAYDKHDKPITDLKPEEIEIYDNGKKQNLKNFQHPSNVPPGPLGNAITNAGPPDQPVADLLILLIDESHLPFNDLNRARMELQSFLKSSPPTARIALYSITEHGSRIIQDVTQDHALISQRLAAWQPDASSVSRAQDLDIRNRQQIDTVRNPDDLPNVNGNIGGKVDYIQTPDPALRLLGDNPLRSSLESMIALARHFAPTPGHKSLVWITGDSALVDREDKAVNMEKGDKSPNAALARVRQVFNEARIALYAVDASPLTPSGGAAVDASLYNPTITVNPVATVNSAPGGAGGPSGAAIGAGRVLTDMQENSRPIQTTVRLLAEGTGGLAIRKGGNLEKTLTGIESHASALYELGFYPDTPADNKFHTLVLKIPSRKDAVLRYRTGYLYAEEATNTKQRFQEAVWTPQDLTGVSITADAVAADVSATGKPAIHIRIALAGLDLQNKDGQWTDNLYVFIAQRDDAEQKAQVDGDTLRLHLKQSTYESGMPAGIPYRHEVEAKAKLGSIRVIVVDGNSGRMGSVTLPTSAFQAATP